MQHTTIVIPLLLGPYIKQMNHFQLVWEIPTKLVPPQNYPQGIDNNKIQLINIRYKLSACMRDNVSGYYMQALNQVGLVLYQNIIYMPIRLVPYFGGRFCPIFGQEKDEFLAMDGRALLDKIF